METKGFYGLTYEKALEKCKAALELGLAFNVKPDKERGSFDFFLYLGKTIDKPEQAEQNKESDAA